MSATLCGTWVSQKCFPHSSTPLHRTDVESYGGILPDCRSEESLSAADSHIHQ